MKQTERGEIFLTRTRATLHAVIGALLLLTGQLTQVRADEGMYPLSELHRLDLGALGLKVSATDIFNPGQVGLIDAIVRIGGCTGSFVSPEGLIITNHHCAFGVVRDASTPGQDYIRNGFLAADRTGELRARGMTVRITESYRDVSDDILGALSDTMGSATRSKVITQKRKEIIAAAEQENPGKRAEVAEMFIGKSYVLFIYTYLRDVRAVYVPPRSIGEFGGEFDNWIWPRHTGDFAFMRAYVAPDGSPAEYSPENVPYTPKKFLRVNPAGVEENDNVFILGYPGRTYRHRSSHFLSYEEDIRMPYVADLYEWEISVLQAAGAEDPAIEIKNAGRIKYLSNVMKNYRGKLTGLRRINLVARKQDEEKELRKFISADPALSAQYGGMLEELDSIYNHTREVADRELTLSYMRRGVTLLNIALTLHEASAELQKPDLERRSQFMERSVENTRQGTSNAARDFVESVDQIFLREFLLDAANLPDRYRIGAIDSLIGTVNVEAEIDRFIAFAYETTRLTDTAYVLSLFGATPEELSSADDPFLVLAANLLPQYNTERESNRLRGGALSKLYAKFVDVKQEFLEKRFIPDANGTVRLTFGSIKGYSPADALRATPITTIRGVIDKTTGREPFDTPAGIRELYDRKDYGKLASRKLKSLPVCLLYNLDTTGGNSGSPLLNALGELVGVNFDRAYEATINDYAWNDSYSRSIAVDIRYVLWVTAKFAGATHITREMGIESVD